MQLDQSSISMRTFKSFLFEEKINRVLLLCSLILITIQFTIFKYYYPFASFIYGDSFSYLDTAHQNLNINTYMVGYSRFLRLFSVITSSDTILVAFQYVFIQLASWSLIFSIAYLYRLSKATYITLLVFMVFNPLFLHMGNLISSDCLFAALSMIWISLLLWVIHQPTLKIIVWHGIVMFIAFTFRYNALIYPFISGVAFIFSPYQKRKRWIGFTIGIALCSLFVLYTGNEYKKLTGIWQYAPFSGWQWANNAMYAYRYVDKSERKEVDQKFKMLDSNIRAFFDSTKDVKKFQSEAAIASTFYMWSKGMPLVDYKDHYFKKDTTSEELKKWATVAPFFKDYGIHIIKKYPLHYLEHFIWPNANKYYAPPVEFLENYNSGYTEVPARAKNWFGYKNSIIKSRFQYTRVIILNYYPILSGIVNILILFFGITYFSIEGFKTANKNKKGIIIILLFWLGNAAFTILASSAALRFQAFPILLSAVSVGLLIDMIIKVIEAKEMNNNRIEKQPTHNLLINQA